MNKIESTIEIFDKYATQYETRFMNFDLYNDTFDIFCENISKQSAEVLEVACGPGNITQYLLKKRPDLKVLGTDLAPSMLEIARKYNPSAEFQLKDARKIADIGKMYDAIMCGFGLPYFSKEESMQFIVDASRILHKGGVLYVSTMEDDYQKSGLQKNSMGDECYIHYHQADYLVATLEENGFKIVNLQRKNFPTKEGNTTIDLIIIATK